VAVAAKLRSIPFRRVRLVHHVISLWDGMRAHHKQLVWRALRFVDVVICNGYAVRDGVIGTRRLRPRVMVLTNGVDCDHFAPMPTVRQEKRRELGFTPEHFVFGTVANVRPVKNYRLLLTTMQRVAGLHPRVRVVCVGGGTQLDEMRQFARTLGIADRVVFTGQVEDVRPWMVTFDAFVLTSVKEGCPNALMQAMAMALPTMSSAVGEVPNLTEGGRCGLLFNPNDAEGCFAAAQRLLEDEPLRNRLAAAGRQRMEAHYSAAKVIADYVAVFQDTADLQPR
jgi:glycosyltransferase involved in cell wall biosynthesis